MHACEPSQLEELTEKLLGFFKGAAPKNPSYAFVPEIEMIRQNSPPDQRDRDATEQDSDGILRRVGARWSTIKQTKKSQVTSEKARWHEDTKCLKCISP
jgi:hypothetical protein